MSMLITFLPILFWLLFMAGGIICVWLVIKKSSSNKDQMLRQLIEKNKELEAKIDCLLAEKEDRT